MWSENVSDGTSVSATFPSGPLKMLMQSQIFKHFLKLRLKACFLFRFNDMQSEIKSLLAPPKP